MMALFVRLGFWQLDRLEQKRAYNTTLSTRWHQEPFNLSQESLPAALESLEYRRVTATGTFDYAHRSCSKAGAIGTQSESCWSPLCAGGKPSGAGGAPAGFHSTAAPPVLARA
jgi:cytochrome oxidase assembly protein ShyY1